MSNWVSVNSIRKGKAKGTSCQCQITSSSSKVLHQRCALRYHRDGDKSHDSESQRSWHLLSPALSTSQLLVCLNPANLGRRDTGPASPLPSLPSEGFFNVIPLQENSTLDFMDHSQNAAALDSHELIFQLCLRSVYTTQ